MHGARQKHTPPMDRHSVPAWLQLPSHVGAPLPPEQNGGRQVSGKPGAGPTQFQPTGQVPPHGGGGGPVKHAQLEICTPPQQVKVSTRHVVPAGQSPSPQLGYTPPHGVLPAGRQPQLEYGVPPMSEHTSPAGHSPLHAGQVPPQG